MTSIPIREDGKAATPDKQQTTVVETASPAIQRIRHVPDWEIPVNPPKRPYFSRARISRSWRRTKLASAFRPRAKPPPRSVTSPTSVDSLPKENTAGAASSSSVLPTHHRSTFHSFPTPPATLNGRSLPARFRARLAALLPGDAASKKRTRFVFVLILLGLAIVAIALGLGLGLGLRRQNRTLDLPLPDGGVRTQKGDLTFFRPALGACGWNNSELDAICAVGHELFDAAGENASAGGNPNRNPLCGMRIRVTREFVEDSVSSSSGQNVSVDVVVVDRCVGCEATDLDLSPGVFGRLAPESRGRVVGRWEWLP